MKQWFTNAKMISTHLNSRCKVAFTLAEVLITLGIVGVVAAMTIPTIVNKVKEKQTVVHVKKSYSVLSQAYTRAIAEHGAPEYWNYQNPNEIFNIWASYVNEIAICDATNDCFGEYKTLTGTQFNLTINNNDFKKFIMSDGTAFAYRPWGTECNNNCGTGKLKNSMCSYIFIDINGKNPPNQAGVDLFGFIATKYGLFPTGMVNADSHCGNLEMHCNLTQSNHSNGLGCSAWVILQGNMDYLHKYVSW